MNCVLSFLVFKLSLEKASKSRFSQDTGHLDFLQLWNCHFKNSILFFMEHKQTSVDPDQMP